MHSYWNRVNTALTFFGTVAAVLCVITSLTDVIHQSNPKIKVGINEIKRFTTYRSNDQVYMSLFIDADLRSIFSWNTKQLFVYIQAEYSTPDNHLNEVVLWDQIVQSRSEAHIAVRNLRQKYPFIDQGKHLRGRELNLTLVWNVMPKVGYLYTQKQSFRMDPMPDSYIY